MKSKSQSITEKKSYLPDYIPSSCEQSFTEENEEWFVRGKEQLDIQTYN